MFVLRIENSFCSLMHLMAFQSVCSCGIGMKRTVAHDHVFLISVSFGKLNFYFCKGMDVLLTTERLVLRRFQSADLKSLFDLHNDPHVMRYINGGEQTPLESIEKTTLPLFMAYDSQVPEFGFWAAIHKDTKEFLGWFSFRCANKGCCHDVDMGYRLCKKAWGNGYATEGAKAMISKGFKDLGVKNIFATTYEDNLASERVMQKLNMELVKRFRYNPEDLKQNDTAHSNGQLWDGDDLEYKLSREDWQRGH